MRHPRSGLISFISDTLSENTGGEGVPQYTLSQIRTSGESSDDLPWAFLPL
jgi:hypothetical protein